MEDSAVVPVMPGMAVEGMATVWQAKELAEPASSKYLSFSALVGTVVSGRRDDEAPMTPFRPFRAEPSVQVKVTHDQVRFAHDDYQGSIFIGWEHPWCRRQRHSKVIREQRGWMPWLTWSMWKRCEESRFTECHIQWDRDIRRDATWDEATATLADTLDRTLDPELAFSNRRFVYRLDAVLISAFERYLIAYLQRPAVQEHIWRLAEG